MVRPDVLGLHRDAFGRGHRRDRRRLQHLRGACSARSSGPTSTATASTPRWSSPRSSPRCASSPPPPCSSPSTPTTSSQLRSPWFWLLAGFTLLGSVAGMMRNIAISTCVTLLVPEERARQGERQGRHRHRRLVRHHVGVQRPRHRQPGHGLGALRRGGADRRWRWRTSSRSTSTSPSPCRLPRARRPATSTCGAPSTRSPPCRGCFMLILLRRLQQLPRRRVHGADGRLRPVARLGRDLGLPVGLHQPGLHRRRPRRRPPRPRLEPAAARARRQPPELDRVLGVRAAVVDRDADRRHDRVARPHPGHRGGRADGAAAVDPVRAPGPGLRLRPAGRERGVAADRLPHGTAGRGRSSCRS